MVKEPIFRHPSLNQRELMEAAVSAESSYVAGAWRLATFLEFFASEEFTNSGTCIRETLLYIEEV